MGLSLLLVGCTTQDNFKDTNNSSLLDSNNISSNTPISCEDLNCFIEASKNCETSVWNSEYNTTFEIKGLQDNKCIVHRGPPMDDDCPFEKIDLTAMLERWKIGNFSTEDWSTCESQWKELMPSDENESCTENWQCSLWSQCVNGTQTRPCLDVSQCGTDINKPEISQSCTTALETCITFTYTDWGDCVNGKQTRTVVVSLPKGCTGGKPITSQNCTVKANCVDSDGGKDYSVKGSIIGPSSFTNRQLDEDDYCMGTTLYEYYCQNDMVYVEEKICDFGCTNGVCLAQSQSNCSIEDGRKIADEEIQDRYPSPVLVEQILVPASTTPSGQKIPAAYEYEYCDESDEVTHAKIVVTIDNCEFRRYQLISQTSEGSC